MKFTISSAVLFASAPLALLLPGCSGGGLPGNPFATATPRPGATATATASPAVSQTSNFTLGNRQRAILKTTRNGTSITGTMQILAPLAQTRTSAALTRSIKVGTFSINGTFTPQRGFDITVRDGNTTLFTMNGLFPTATETGTYTLNFNGETDSGIIPRIGDVTPGVTPTPTTPSAGGFGLQITPQGASNFDRYITTGTNSVLGSSQNRPYSNPAGGSVRIYTLSVIATVNSSTVVADTTSVRFDLASRTPLAAGQSFSASGYGDITGFGGAFQTPVSQVSKTILLTPTNAEVRSWRSTGGNIKIVSLTSTGATLQVSGVTYTAVTEPGFSGTGNLLANGTFATTFFQNQN